MTKKDAELAELRAKMETYSDEQLQEVLNLRFIFSDDCPLEIAKSHYERRYLAEDILATRQADQPWAIKLRARQQKIEDWYAALNTHDR